MNNIIRNIGWDPGFFKNAAAEVVSIEREEEGSNGQHTTVIERQIVTTIVPSVVGVGSTEIGALDLAGVVQPARQQKIPAKVAFDNIEYLVGHGVEQFAEPLERMDFQRFADSPELRALLYASIYPLLNSGTHRLRLLVGLPVEALGEDEQAATIERDMSNWLLGEHRFAINGAEAIVDIIKIKLKPQPLAAWLDWGLNEEGLWRLGKEWLRAPVLVIDPGFNTLDLYGIENGRVNVRYTDGKTLGMRRAAEMIINNLRRTDMSLHEADELVLQVTKGKKALVYMDGELTDMTKLVRQAINSLGAETIKFIEKKVGQAGKFKVLIPGGGGLAMKDWLLRLYPKATIMGVMANAQGLGKAASRPGFWN